MLSNALSSLLARERSRALWSAGDRFREVGLGATPVTRVTLRYAAAADSERLQALARLDAAAPPVGPALVAEVDGRLRAALPLDGTPPIADPFHNGCELIELLRLRAGQLARAA